MKIVFIILYIKGIKKDIFLVDNVRLQQTVSLFSLNNSWESKKGKHIQKYSEYPQAFSPLSSYET